MRGSSGFVHASFVRVSPVLILRRWAANAAWKARVSNLERAEAWMPERMPGGAALGSPEPTTIRVPTPPPRCAGSGSAVVSSQDFFAVGCCGGSCLTEVAKNSNAPRAPAVPSASLCDAARANKKTRCRLPEQPAPGLKMAAVSPCW